MRQERLSHVDATFGDARTLFRSGRYQETLQAVEPLLEHADPEVRGRAVLFTVAGYRRMYQLTRALALLDARMDAMPESLRAAAQVDRAGILSMQGKWEQAGQQFQDIVQQVGTESEWSGECYRGMAWCASQLGHYQESLFYVAKAVQLLRRSNMVEGLMAAYVDMSNTLMALGRYQHARRCLDRASRFLQAVPQSAVRLRALIALVRWELEHGSAERAERRLAETWAALDPASPAQRGEVAWCHLLQARVELARGNRSGAMTAVRAGSEAARGLADAIELRRELAITLRAAQV